MNINGSISFQQSSTPDTSGFLTGADNGLSLSGTTVQLGGGVGSGDGMLIDDREVPTQGFSIVLLNAAGRNAFEFRENTFSLGRGLDLSRIQFISDDGGGGVGNNWALAQGYSTATTGNPLLFRGWNVNGSGGKVDVNSYYFAVGMEARYDPDPIDPLSKRSEYYIAFNNDAGTEYRRGIMFEFSHNSMRTEETHQITQASYFDASYSLSEAALSINLSGGEVVFGMASRPLLDLKQYSFDGLRKVKLINVEQATFSISLSLDGGAPFIQKDALQPGAPIKTGFPTLTTNFWENSKARPNFVDFIGGQIYGFGSSGLSDPVGMQRVQAGYQAAASAIDLYGSSTVPDADRCIIFYTSATERMRLQNDIATFSGAICTGGSANTWELGALTVGASVLDGSQYLNVSVNGVSYKLALIV